LLSFMVLCLLFSFPPRPPAIFVLRIAFSCFFARDSFSLSVARSARCRVFTFVVGERMLIFRVARVRGGGDGVGVQTCWRYRHGCWGGVHALSLQAKASACEKHMRSTHVVRMWSCGKQRRINASLMNKG
jgi:hypothetical protein